MNDDMALFFHAVFPDLGGQYLLIWTIPNKLSYWTTAITPDTFAYCHTQAATQNVYVGCGLAAHDYGSHVRCPAQDITAIPGLWLDIDYGPGHKKDHLPKTQLEAMQLLEAMGLPPSLVVHSGHGLQAWWLFKELWTFSAPHEREAAATLTSQWNKTFLMKAQQRGWAGDNTGDLARVMRIPGTHNHKGVMVPTSLLWANETRYDPLDFETYLLAPPPEQPPIKAGSIPFQLVLSPDAQPPAEKFTTLFDNEPKFRASWLHTGGLPSQSEYDLSLATYTSRAGWTPQEVTNCLIANRHKHGEDLKLREKYYVDTLNKAAQQTLDLERAQVLDTFRREGTLPDDVVADPAELFRVLSDILQVPITKVIIYSGDEASYSVEINGKLISFGTIEGMLNQNRFRARFADATRLVPARQTSKQWDQIIQYILDAGVVEATGMDGCLKDRIHYYLQQYLTDRGVSPTEGHEIAAYENRPFQINGSTYISTRSVCRYLDVNGIEKLTHRSFAIHLKGLGAVPQSLDFRHEGKHFSRYVWDIQAIKKSSTDQA